jgi:hypothetical protein
MGHFSRPSLLDGRIWVPASGQDFFERPAGSRGAPLGGTPGRKPLRICKGGGLLEISPIFFGVAGSIRPLGNHRASEPPPLGPLARISLSNPQTSPHDSRGRMDHRPCGDESLFCGLCLRASSSPVSPPSEARCFFSTTSCNQAISHRVSTRISGVKSSPSLPNRAPYSRTTYTME